jgi:hypothetical protein
MQNRKIQRLGLDMLSYKMYKNMFKIDTNQMVVVYWTTDKIMSMIHI